MKLLMISTDRNVLNATSVVAKRMRCYGERIDSLTILLAGVGRSQNLTLSPRVTVVYPGGINKVHNFFRLLIYARTHKATIVTTQDPVFMGLVGLFSGIRPLQVQLHTDTFSFIHSIVARMVLARASCVRAVSEKAAECARRFTRAPVSILPIFVDASRFLQNSGRPADMPTGPVVLAVARLAPEKRVDFTIRAFQKSGAQHLVILGDGPERKKLTLLVEQLGVVGRVHFLGWKDDVAPYYRFADCFVQTSAYEGYGLALLEAALSGCPAISTDVGNARSIGAPLVTICTGDEYAFGGAIAEVLAQGKTDAQKIAQQKLISGYDTIETYVDRYITLLTTC